LFYSFKDLARFLLFQANLTKGVFMKNFIKIATTAIIAATISFAQNADSLKAEIERMTAQLQAAQLEPEIEEIEIISPETQKENVSTTSFSTSRKDVTITTDDSTITIVKVKSTKDSDIEADTTIRTIRIIPKFSDGNWGFNSIFGIGGGFGIGGMYMDMRPVKNLYRDLKVPVPFDNREPILLTGGFGFGGLVNGVRAGGAGYGGNSEFRSQRGDTMFVAKVSIGYGGFIIGRGWTKDKNAFHFQTLIGAGSQDVEFELREAEGTTFYTGGSHKKGELLHKESFDSRFFACDLQTGYTRSVMPWFHIGTEISGLLMVSRNGYNFDNYVSFNPTMKARFIFGSLR
jgi:hypothetical protein